MRIAGILCEYNPFHKGHEKQISAVKQRTDFLVCLMSGSFVQRGEPAIFDKFTRARWALAAGAHAVFELPCVYSLSSAEGFALGGMRLFEKIGIDTLYFGSECALHDLTRLADAYEHQSQAFTDAFHQSLSSGISYAAAKEQAARQTVLDLPDSVFMRNAMLGTEYILGLRKIGSYIKPVALKRFGDVSASNVRSVLESKHNHNALPSAITDVLPDSVLEDILSLRVVTTQQLSAMLLYRLRMMEKDEYADLPGISEGLDNRLYHAARQATNYEELLALSAHRRMPFSRIKRTLMCALLYIDSKIHSKYAHQAPNYLRLLAMREDAADLIAHIKKQSGLPIVTQPAHYRQYDLLNHDLRATDVHALLSLRPAGLDYTTRLITL